MDPNLFHSDWEGVSEALARNAVLPPRRRQVLASILALFVGIAAQVDGQTQQPSPLKTVGATRLTLDPVCNARGGVTLISPVRNDGQMPVDLALSVGDLMSKTAGKIAMATASLTPPRDGTGPDARNKPSLAPHEMVDVRVDIKGTLDSGEWDIDLRNAGLQVGTFTIVSPQVGFGVKLDTGTPDVPTLVFERGKEAIIPLKNDDPFSYRVSGRYTVRGVAYDMREIPLSANSGGEFTLTPKAEWFAPATRVLFRDDVEEGRLTLRFSSPACAQDAAIPTRVLKAKTTLNPWETEAKDIRGNGVLLSTLLLGGICSLALNFFLPAHSRRRATRAQLSVLARLIDDLPNQGDPRVRVSVAVERRQLEERLRRLKFYDGQFFAAMTEIEQGLTRLSTRLDLIAQMELVLNRYWRQRCVIVSDDIEELRRQLLDLLKRSEPKDQDIRAIQTLINKLNDLVTNAAVANPDLAARLARSVVRLRMHFDGTTGDVGISPVWQGLRNKLANKFEEVLGTSPMTDPATISPPDYASLARSIFTLEVVGEFITLCGAANSAGALPTEQASTLDAVIRDLRGGTWESLKRAERRVRQLREGVSYDDVETQIKNQRVQIVPNRNVVRQFEPTELRAIFLDKRVQNSAAREEYTCNWFFEQSNLPVAGWTVSYLFPVATEGEPQTPESNDGRFRRFWSLRRTAESKQQQEAISTAIGPPYQVKVTFVRDDGFAVPGEITTEIRVRGPLVVKVRASFWTELLRLSLALGIAAFGLIVGAREQILKLDLLPALIAVFLLGFGSDRIKNLFTQPSPATPAAGASAPTGSPVGVGVGVGVGAGG
jgi:hypothetical protein